MKYNINKNLMDVIDTGEKAYWLGFFYADAYNNEKLGRIVIELQEKDKNHLYKCANFFGNPRQPFIQYKNKGKYIAYRLEINSKHLSKSLKEKGCHNFKSFNIKFPNFIKKNQIHHFIRGYFDGDGSIYIHQNQLNVCIVSTKEFNISIQKILKDQGVNSHIRFPKRYKNNTSVLEFGGSRQVKKFCDWIYEDANIFLYRKNILFNKYCENHKFRKI